MIGKSNAQPGADAEITIDPDFDDDFFDMSEHEAFRGVEEIGNLVIDDETEIKTLKLGDLTKIGDISIDCSSLEKLDLSGIKEFKGQSIEIKAPKLTSLELSSTKALKSKVTTINIFSNALVDVDLTGFASLESVNIAGKKIVNVWGQNTKKGYPICCH